MIGKVMKGRGFAGLARYLETGRDGDSPDRVEWVETRNLPTNDPHTASLIMRATSAQSVRVQKPVYHISLSFDPDDRVDHATMVRVADRLLSDLGLERHQALIVGDTRHAHVHLMINRVHPETFRRGIRSATTRALSGRFANRNASSHCAPFPATTTGSLATSRRIARRRQTARELRKWDRTGRVPFDEIVRKAVRLVPVEAQRAEPREASWAFNDVLEKVYRDPARPSRR